MSEGVKTKKPEYIEAIPKWEKSRDCYDGQDKIKSKGTAYLPATGGQTREIKEKRTQNKYDAYNLRATFPEIVKPTLEGMMGLIHRRPAAIEVPDKMTLLLENITIDGVGVNELHKRITKELLKVGRYGLLVDLPESGGDPYVATYKAESIINWKSEIINGDEKLTLVVLHEIAEKSDTANVFGTEVFDRYRVLQLIDGEYMQTVYSFENGVQSVELEVFPTAGGKRLDEIPFVFVSPDSLTTEIGPIPLMGVCNVSLSIYRNSADYEQALFMVSQPTPFIFGVDKKDLPKAIGSDTIWSSKNPQTKAGFAETSGNGLESFRFAINDKKIDAVNLGANLINVNKNIAESGEAKKQDSADKSTIIVDLAQYSAYGLQTALRFVAVFMGVAPEDVTVQPNLDFTAALLTAEDALKLTSTWMSGGFADSDLFFNLKRGERLPRDRTFEEWQDEREISDNI